MSYLLCFVNACNFLPSKEVEPLESVSLNENLVNGEKGAEVSTEKIVNTESDVSHRRQLSNNQNHHQIVGIGSGNFIANPTHQDTSQILENSDGEITLNFEDTDLREIVKVVLGDILAVNYLMDPKVAGKVTIGSTHPLNKSELIPLLDDILGMNGAVLVRSNDRYQVLSKKETLGGYLSAETDENNRKGGYRVQLIPLRHIAATEMQKILEPFIADGKDVRIDKRRNLLIVSGTAKQIRTIQDTIAIFDVDWLSGMSFGLYPLDYVDPKTMKSELDSIVGAIQGDTSSELLDGLVRTVPIERLNSILLVGSTLKALREIEIWLYRLDRPGEHVGQRLYVYDVKNAKALEIADILNNILGTSSTLSTSTLQSSQSTQLAPGLTPVEISENGVKQPALPSSTIPIQDTGLVLPNASSIEIIADDVRNALVVLSTPRDYKMVAETIKELDVAPLQVVIEASILEISLRDDLSYGVEWFFNNTIDGSERKSGRSTLDLGSTGINALSPGFSFTVVDAADQVRLALNALQNESEVNVLSSPSLMVLDKETAMINVGDEIPVPSRQSISNLDPSAPTVNEIQFRQTGITLTVTPRVNSGGLVTMEIKQEVSTAVSTTSSDIDAPTIQQRQVESVVAINSGDTIVLGGLIQNTQTDNEGGIPVLHKIPLIGKLFGQTSSENRRTEILVLITPRVIGDRDDAREITDEFRRRLRGLKPANDILQDTKVDSTS